MLALFALPMPAFAQDSLALRIKATYLYKFAPFVEWPPAVSEAPTFDICVIGDDPFGRIIDEAIAGQSAQAKPFRIVRLDLAEDAAECRIMYLAGSKEQSIEAALRWMHGKPVLTVTDGDRAKTPQGVIHFVEREGKIKFSIDKVSAEESGLVIGSQLLDLAVSVRSKGADAGSVRVQ